MEWVKWLISLIIAVALLSATIVFAVKRRRDAYGLLSPFRILFVGVFLTVAVLMFPIQADIYLHESLGWFRTIVFSLHTTIQMFKLDADPYLIEQSVTVQAAGGLASVYAAVTYVFYGIAPVLTVGFIASLFKSVTVHLGLLLTRFRTMYAFSEMNEKSLALAEDLHRRHPHAVIAFFRVNSGNEEQSGEAVSRAVTIGALCFPKDILSENLKRWRADRSLYLFAISEEESCNITDALRLKKEYGNQKNTYLYAFTTNAESDMLLTDSDSDIRIYRVNGQRLLIYNLLYERGTELFECAAVTETGEKVIHAVLVGLGGCGTEMLKALSWYCQMDGYRVVIDAFDKDPLVEQKVTALCPELLSPQYNGVIIEGEAQYTIRIHAGVDYETETFADSIVAMRDVTYALTALGDDSKDVSAAATLRMLFERSHIHPVIHAMVYDSEEKHSIIGADNFKGDLYDIEPIGGIEDTYTEAVVLHSALEEEAFARHKGYCNGNAEQENQFWQYEYCYRSSMASALHLRARIAVGIPGADKSLEEQTEAEQLGIEVLEHRRWNAYMRSEGYVYSGSPEKSSRNDLGRMHNNLVPYAELPENVKRLDSLVGSKH